MNEQGSRSHIVFIEPSPILAIEGITNVDDDVRKVTPRIAKDLNIADFDDIALIDMEQLNLFLLEPTILSFKILNDDTYKKTKAIAKKITFIIVKK